MNLTLKRIAQRPGYTIGRLYVDGHYYCDTLEDTVRDLSREKKVAGQTAIPPGRYAVTVTRSPKFGRRLPRLLNVPGFEGILIHRGNSAADTSGCILVGENKVVGRLINSTPYEQRLTRLLEEAHDRGECISIEVI